MSRARNFFYRLCLDQLNSTALCEALRAVLKTARLEAGLSLNELSKRSGVNRIAITMIERGDRTPGIDTFSRIANGLGILPSELWRVAEEYVKSS